MGKAGEMDGEIQEGIKEKIGMAGEVISGVGEVSAQWIAINGATNRGLIENTVNSKLNRSTRIHWYILLMQNQQPGASYRPKFK